MNRVLVPLDGSPFAESIIPDARRLAGADGTLILVRDASQPAYNLELSDTADSFRIAACETYLESIARPLRTEGVRIEVHTTYLNEIALAIDAAADLFHADIIACSTHGRTVWGRLVRGGAAWQALAGSTVPVVLRHGEDRAPSEHDALQRRRIMVPLDGSAYAEKALSLAQQLAHDWDAQLLLVRVVVGAHGFVAPYAPGDTYAVNYQDEVASAHTYMNALVATLSGDVKTHITGDGVVAERLAEVVEADSITDVVMASHGRTGLSRVVLGSVADSLIHRLHIPVIIIPALVPTIEVEHVGSEQVEAIPVHA